MNKKPVTPDKALTRLQDLCIKSEQCSFDLRRKLFTWGVPADAADKIVNELIAGGFVDDERFAGAFTRDRYRFSGWGRIKIRLHLSSKRINSPVIEKALQSIDESEYNEVALKVLKAKARTLKEGNTFEGRTKLYRFGVSRGFETSLVASLIKSGAVWG